MKPTTNNTMQPDRLDREAAEWVVRWGDCERPPTLNEQSRWFGWLRRSPQHVQSYFDTADLYEQLAGMDPDHRIDIDEWLAAGRAPVVSIAPAAASSTATVTSARSAPSRSRRTRWGLAAVAASVVIGVLTWSLHTSGTQQYRTGVGQQSIYRLADGSVMSLNTRTRAKVLFTKERRLIELEGEGLFTVAPDASRPFYVRTRGATVRAVGTKFNVYQQSEGTKVAVIEGLVQVTPGDEIPPLPAATDNPTGRVADVPASVASSVALSAGEAARVAEGRIVKQTLSHPDAATAWQHQQLVFEDASLSEVAAQFNRYNEQQIHVEEFVGRSKRLSGTFDALHPQSLVLYLKKDPSLTVRPAGTAYWILPRSPPQQP